MTGTVTPLRPRPNRPAVLATATPAGRLAYLRADPGRDPRGRYVTFAYTARLAGTPAPAAQDDAADARWLLVDDVIQGRYPLAFDHARIVDDALRVVVEGQGQLSRS